MLTKADFQKTIQDSIAAYPAIAPLYQAGDPRITQHLDAMASMLSMLSSQIEVSMSESFDKVRDATVLADAAMRGIVRKAISARVRLLAANKGGEDFSLESGRTVIDSAGIPYRIETSASIPAGGAATVEAVQVQVSTLRHTVTNSEPFYSIEIPAAEDGTFLCGIAIHDVDGEFAHRERYVNTFPDERIFHIEADDRQRVYARFGFDGIVGVQPMDGHEIVLSVSYTAGEASPAFGSPFSFEYIASPLEATVELTMDALLLPGQNPPAMSTLRDLARYPSVYDHNAVFLGEFDFLVRRSFPALRFLSVWNESAEEQARGPSLDNINTLFVACLSSAGGESILAEEESASPVPPAVIADDGMTDTQREIKAAILAADDSYKVRFFTPVRSKITMTISAKVATSYVASDVREKIIEAILSEFGETAAASRRGRNRPLYQRVYSLLRERVSALSGGNADLTVNIEEPASLSARPEMWRYVAADSLHVAVDTINIVTPSWGG